MHKQEASYLFSILSNGERVKILKFLYNNKIVYTFDMIKAFVDLNEEELKSSLDLLLNNNLILSKDNGYMANYQFIDELMDFIRTPCGCSHKWDLII